MKKEVKSNKKKIINKYLIYSAISFVLFGILTLLILLKITRPLDLAVESAIIGIRTDGLTKVMVAITNLGSAYCLISLTIVIILIAIIKNKRLPLYSTVNLISIFLTSELFKIIARRDRPTGLFLTTASGYSYPSGHSIVSYAYYAFIAISLCEKINNKLLKLFIRIATTILILAIGFSRIYLGVHFITDVLGSYLLGTSYLFLFLDIRRKNIKKKEKSVKE